MSEELHEAKFDCPEGHVVIKREVEKLEINNDEDYYYKAQMLLKKPLKKYTEKLEFFDRLIENDE